MIREFLRFRCSSASFIFSFKINLVLFYFALHGRTFLSSLFARPVPDRKERGGACIKISFLSRCLTLPLHRPGSAHVLLTRAPNTHYYMATVPGKNQGPAWGGGRNEVYRRIRQDTEQGYDEGIMLLLHSKSMS